MPRTAIRQQPAALLLLRLAAALLLPACAPARAPATAPAPTGALAATRAAIVATARAELGRPYRYGGSSRETGWDCSGLMQFAFRAHGIAIPRRSVEQATIGRALPRDLDQLEPADILTFAEEGERVTHVGLYLGEGRFLHSASTGVREDVLSEQDPVGRWWVRRWVGGRRVVE